MEQIKTLSFFGENGITSTSANHVANLAKEAVRDAHEYLESIQFYDENIGLLTSDVQQTVSFGIAQVSLDGLSAYIDEIAQANSLIAFLREAIKEKEKKMKEAQQWTDAAQDEELRKEGAELMLARPVREDYPTVESIKQCWSVGEQEHYLSLEAEAAVIGKFIHEDGALSRARIDLMSKVKHPRSVCINGADTIVHNYVPTVSIYGVDAMFNSLQKRYRSVQAELNGMKKRIDDEISNRKMEIDASYLAKCRQYDICLRHHEEKMRLYQDEREMKRNELCRQVRDLKIVIPNRLRLIYEKLTK